MDDFDEKTGSNDKIWKIITALAVVLFVVAIVFVIIFGLRVQSNNKIKDQEISANLKAQEKVLRNEFLQETESDDIQYTTSPYFGSLKFSYPKIWSTNIAINEGSGEEFIFMADPNLIEINEKAAYTPTALKVTINKDRYETVLKKLEDKNKSAKAPYKWTEADTVVSEIKGKVFSGLYSKENPNRYIMVLVPYRDKTLIISTDGSTTEDTYKSQFEKTLSSFELRK